MTSGWAAGAKWARYHESSAVPSPGYRIVHVCQPFSRRLGFRVFQAPCCDAGAFALRVLAVECDTLKKLVAATGGDSAATVASIGLLEPGMGERRTVIAWSRDQRTPVAGLKRTLQRVSVAISLSVDGAGRS